VSERFLAVFLYAFAGCTLLGILPTAVLAARARDRPMVILAVVLGLAVAGLLANGAADLWAAAG